MAGLSPLRVRVPVIRQVLSFPGAAGRWLRQLRPRFGRATSAQRQNPEGPVDPLLQAGNLLRGSREERGLSMRQLAQQTRISTVVIEALERGWRERLPEPAYLRTMLPLLERELGLGPGSLEGALPPRVSTAAGGGREPLLRRFTPGSIDVFTSWQGTVLYGLVTLGLIHLLNLQQLRLAARGLHSSRPIPALEGAPAALAAGGPEAAVLAAYPDLRPLQRPTAGRGLERLRRETLDPGPDLGLSELQLDLEGPTAVELSGSRSSPTRLPEVRGQLSLPVLPPFELQLEPAPAADAVRWRGAVLRPEPGSPGRYRYPPPPPSRPPQAGPPAAAEPPRP